MNRQVIHHVAIAGALALAGCASRAAPAAFSGLREVNPPAAADSDRITVITGARLIDGRGSNVRPLTLQRRLGPDVK